MCEERRIGVYQSFVGSDYMQTLGLELAEGRFVHPDIGSDSTKYIIINLSAMNALGIDISPLLFLAAFITMLIVVSATLVYHFPEITNINAAQVLRQVN